MKRLLIMRHAKSDWSTAAPDHERPLNRRGRRSAKAIGRLLTRMGEVPDLVYTSTALRARTTVELAAAAGEWDTEIELKDELYGTSPDGALRVVSGAPDVPSLMLVGHQPAWGGLVAEITGGAVQVKTATVVGIELYAADWADAERARGEILYVLQPRLLLDGGAH